MNLKTDFFINTGKRRRNYSLENYFTKDVFEFHKSLPAYSPTPLFNLKLNFQLRTKPVICLKDESQRFSVGAFKSLGASWAIGNFLKKNKGQFTFCTATDGNHGRAVAWSARIFGHKARVYMPDSTVDSRVKFIEEEGAEVIIVNGDYDDAVEQAKKAGNRKNHVLIQDTSWPGYEHFPNLICAGYTTIIKEIEDQLKNGSCTPPEVIILQSGVGSWAASTMLYLSRSPGLKKTKYIILEPLESDCLLESAKNGKLSTTSKSQNTIMAGLNCGTPSLMAWEIISDMADAFISIDDGYSEIAVKELYSSGIRTCESGASGLGGLIALYENDKLKPVRESLQLNENTSFLLINTEGITDPDMHSKILASEH